MYRSMFGSVIISLLMIGRAGFALRKLRYPERSFLTLHGKVGVPECCFMNLGRAGVLNSYDWIERFYQRACRPELSWGGAAELADRERSAAAKSLQEFAFTADVEADSAIEWAREIANETGDRGFVWAFRLFLREERHQGWLVNRLLRELGVPQTRRTWTDRVLQTVGRLNAPSLYLHLLVGIELVARGYYRALRDGTQYQLIRDVSARLAEEQDIHIQFAAFALPLMRRRRSGVSQATTEGFHRVFVFAAMLRVWLRHAAVFRQAHWSFQDLYAETNHGLNGIHRKPQLPNGR
jgi:hypothetical protein